MLKINDIELCYLNNRKVTMFKVYELRENDYGQTTWVFDYNSYIAGHYKLAKTIAKKHCEENGVNINLKDWEF